MKLARTIFKNEIIAEFFEPKKDSGNVIILCDGLPALPNKPKVVKLFAKKGYWVFHPRYRGAWESQGTFLEKSPHLDILDVVEELKNGFVNFYTGEKKNINIQKIIVIGASFGGASALMASLDRQVDKVVALAPVVDWKKLSQESIEIEKTFIKSAFGMAYRYDEKGIENLTKGRLLNPVDHLNEFDKNKLFIIHSKDDELVPYKPARDLSKKVGCRFMKLNGFGHLSASILLKRKVFRKVNKFIK